MRTNYERVKSTENIVKILEIVSKKTGIKFDKLYMSDYRLEGEDLMLTYCFEMDSDDYLKFLSAFYETREELT